MSAHNRPNAIARYSSRPLPGGIALPYVRSRYFTLEPGCQRVQVFLIHAHDGNCRQPRLPSKVSHNNSGQLTRRYLLVEVRYPESDLWNRHGATTRVFKSSKPIEHGSDRDVKRCTDSGIGGNHAMGNRQYPFPCKVARGRQIGTSELERQVGAQLTLDIGARRAAQLRRQASGHNATDVGAGIDSGLQEFQCPALDNVEFCASIVHIVNGFRHRKSIS
jgi:hypothetical protein